jgi:hypothetical protein
MRMRAFAHAQMIFMPTRARTVLFSPISQRCRTLSSKMKSLLSVVVVLAVLYARGIESLPTGAPAGACDNLTPFRNPAGHADPPQTTAVPYMINLTPFNNNETWQYTPGNTYNCKLISCLLEYHKNRENSQNLKTGATVYTYIAYPGGRYYRV